MISTEGLEEHKFQDKNGAAPGWLPILMYHHVVPHKSNQQAESLEVTVDEFDAQLKSLRERGYESVHLDEAVRGLLQGKDTAARQVVITFDDGYMDVFLHAFPVLKKYQFTADLFLVSSYVDGSAHQVAPYYSQEHFLGMPEITEMAGYGISFGSHSVSHRRLAGLSYQEAWEEIHWSKVRLERLLGGSINTFSFPYGCSSLALEEMVKDAGYLAACGIDQREHKLYNLSRIDAARCRGADLRWQIHTSGLYFQLRQRNSLRRLKDLFSRLKGGWKGDRKESNRYAVDNLHREREQA